MCKGENGGGALLALLRQFINSTTSCPTPLICSVGSQSPALFKHLSSISPSLCLQFQHLPVVYICTQNLSTIRSLNWSIKHDSWEDLNCTFVTIHIISRLLPCTCIMLHWRQANLNRRGLKLSYFFTCGFTQFTIMLQFLKKPVALWRRKVWCEWEWLPTTWGTETRARLSGQVLTVRQHRTFEQ